MAWDKEDSAILEARFGPKALARRYPEQLPAGPVKPAEAMTEAQRGLLERLTNEARGHLSNDSLQTAVVTVGDVRQLLGIIRFMRRQERNKP